MQQPFSPTVDTLSTIEAEALQLLGQRKRRKRIRYSCTECHRRKHKCDRETPCSKCIERGVASACIPHDGSAQDAHDRVRQLEAVLTRLVEANRHASDQKAASSSSNAYSDVSPQANAASSASTPASARRGASTPRRKSNPAITTAASLPFRAQVGNEMLEFSSSTQSYPPSAHFERLVREGCVQSDEIRNLASSLPSQEQTSLLLDVFFRDINPLMFPFDEMWFREAVNTATDSIWSNDDIAYALDRPNHLSVVSLLYSVLALTYLAQPLQMGTEASGAAQAARMSYQCRRCNMLAASIQCHDAFIVLSHILLARFTILQRQAKDSWLVLGAAVREAQLLGYHRLGAPPADGQKESREDDMCRTIWMHLYYEDRFSSLIVGQAPFIHDAFCDTKPPLDSDPGEDSFHFDLATALRLRYDFSVILSRVLDLFFSDEHDLTYEAVLQIDGEMQAFENALPAPYLFDASTNGSAALRFDTVADHATFRKLALRRFVLHISIAYVRISLHLPYLRRGHSDPGFERSRQAAMEAAISDHRARHRLKHELDWPDHMARDSFVGGRFFYFHATSTLGLCLLSEPDVGRVKVLFPLLDEFLEYAKDHQRQQGVDPNRCVRQEISIVSLIQNRVRRKFGWQEADQSTRATCFAGNGNGSSNPMRTSAVRDQGEAAAQSAQIRPHSRDAAQTPPLLADTQASQPNGADSLHTRQPEAGQDIYEWWSWLVSSLTPSELGSLVTPIDAHQDSFTDTL